MLRNSKLDIMGNAVHVVRTQCKVLYVDKYSNSSFGPLGEHLTRHVRGACTVPRGIRGVANLAPNTKLGEVQQACEFVKGSPIALPNIVIAVVPTGS